MSHYLSFNINDKLYYREDAIKAKDAVKHIDGRTVYVDYADISRKKTKKEKLQDRLRRRQEAGNETVDREKDGRDDEMNVSDNDSNDDDDNVDSDGEEENQENVKKKDPVRERNTDIKGTICTVKLNVSV